MRDARRHRALGKIATIRDAQRAVARHELYLASDHEREALAKRDEADNATAAALVAWESHVEGRFHPELARALAGELVGRVEAGATAHDYADQMTDRRHESEAEWRLGDARCRQAGDALAQSRRSRAREREEHALEILADRISFAWSRP